MTTMSRRLWQFAVVTLAVLGILAAAWHFHADPYNPGFVDHPVITKAHVVLGACYLALAPLQFVKRIRARAISYHRWAGRTLVSMGALVGFSALFLGLVVPFSGNPERVVIAVFGTMFLLFLLLGLVRVRQGRIAQHREWMLRAFAIGLSIATMRLIFLPSLLIVGDPTDQQIAWLSVGSFSAAFVIHVSAAELWIRSTRAGRRSEAAPRRPMAASSTPSR
jgi:uncharacterized membrane protein